MNQEPNTLPPSAFRIIRPSKTSNLVVFDDSHGQKNWSQTGFTSREMHTNYAGMMELFCRLGCVCAPTGLEPLADLLTRTRLMVIPPSTGMYHSGRKCWLPQPESRFTVENIRDILSFVQGGGRLLAFAYRFGDSFTASNLRELISPLGCLLNDDAVIDLQLLRDIHPLDSYFDTPTSLLPLAWSHDQANIVRWRTMATFTILPGSNIKPLALSAGGSCIAFNRSLRRISFASLPVAVAGTYGSGRFALFGGPHAFEIGEFGLLGSHDNGRFLQNVVRWLLDEGQPDLHVEPTSHHALGTFFFNNGLEIVRGQDRQSDQQTVAYVEKVLRRTGVLKALDRPAWMT